MSAWSAAGQAASLDPWALSAPGPAVEVGISGGLPPASSHVAARRVATARPSVSPREVDSSPPAWSTELLAERAARARATHDAGDERGRKRAKVPVDVLGWARRLGVIPPAEAPVDLASTLAARARSRAVAVLDQGKIRSALAWTEDYVAATSGRTFFRPLLGPHDTEGSDYNWASLDGFAEYVRAAGSRVMGKEGVVLKADYIQSLGGLLRILREEATGSAVVIPRAGASRHFKAMRREDGPSGSRDTRRALRAHHMGRLARESYHAVSAARQSDWEAAVVAHNLLLRGGEVGRVENADFDSSRGFSWGCIEWRRASAASGWRAWLVAWICAIKDQNATNRRQPVVVCQRRSDGARDPLCAYSALYDRWLRSGVTTVIDGSRASFRLSRGHRMADRPVFAHADGVAYDTGDVRRVAQEMAAACGEPRERFGGKSFRVGGATDLRCALGSAEGMAVIKQRGRWNSDIAEIYQRALVLDQLEGSAAMGDAGGADLEGLLDGWSQPA